MQKNFKLLKPLTWEEVFNFWRENEGSNPLWAEHAKKRGFTSWEDWRLNGYAKPFQCEEAKWGLYEIKEPEKAISKFYGGPFRTWVENYYDGKKEKTFAELITMPEIFDKWTVQNMAANFPTDKVITCLQLKDKIYVIEGMHRCCALALMNKEGKPAPDKLQVAIGQSDLDELPMVGKNQIVPKSPQQQVVDQIVEKESQKPETVAINIFGSVAHGREKPKSDVDIEIISSSVKEWSYQTKKIGQVFVDLVISSKDFLLTRIKKYPYLSYSQYMGKTVYDPTGLMKKARAELKKYFNQHPEVVEFWERKIKEFKKDKATGQKPVSAMKAYDEAEILFSKEKKVTRNFFRS